MDDKLDRKIHKLRIKLIKQTGEFVSYSSVMNILLAKGLKK